MSSTGHWILHLIILTPCRPKGRSFSGFLHCLGETERRGEKLLQYVLLKSPQSINARLSLAKSYCADGRHSEALLLASEALDLIQTHQWDDFTPEAEKVWAQLHANAGKAN